MYIIKNIFTEEERKKLIENATPFLLDGKKLNMFYDGEEGEYHEGFEWFKLSHSTLHQVPKFNFWHQYLVEKIKEETNLDLKITKSWINLTNGKRHSKNIKWHNHDWDGADYAGVYYMKTLPLINSGTMFKDKFVRAPQNSLLLFPSHLEHSTPHSVFRFNRYSWAQESNIK